MSSVGSFGTFTTARLAIYVSQKGLNVTGNNIANINTVGYTRQRLDQVSFKTGMAERYQNPFDVHVGNGAIAQSVSQFRDPYLDIRYRAEHSSEGFYNGWLNGLKDLDAILDEIGKGENDGDGLIYAQFSDFHSALQQIQVGAGEQVNDTLASTSAETLCQLFYNAANRLEILHKNTEVQLRQEVDSINGLLVGIRELNEAIQQAEIYGDGALELRDSRNVYIDKLSEKLKISATYSMVDIGGKQVEKLTIRLDNANPDKEVTSDSSLLVDGNFCAQLTTPKDNDKYDPAFELFDKNSIAYEKAVQDLKAKREVTNPVDGKPFADQAALDAAIETFLKDPDNMLKPFQFVNEDGEGTNDPRKAAQVFDDHYNITVSDLRDENNKAWVDYPDVRDTFVKDPDGMKLPTKAQYTGAFKFSGVWKNGDKININVGGTDYSVEVGKDLTADAANEDPKNVSNAIRKAMMASGKFNDYEITTKTTRTVVDKKDVFNVQLTVKAKDPEEKVAADMPAITITADAQKLTAGGVTIGTVSQSQKDGKPVEGQFQAEVTVNATNKFNKGDVITIASTPPVTLEVGKDISVNGANNPEKLAAKLAGKMNVAGFTVTSNTDKDGKAYLVFQGAKDAKAPAVPAVKVEAADPVTFTNLNGNWANGKKGDVPKPDPVIQDNGDNTESKIITRYYMDDNDKWHEVVKTINTSKTKMLDDNDLFGKLQAVREMLTEEGEFSSKEDIEIDESAAIKRGIPYYQEALDLLARQFAETMNEANNGFAVDEYGNYLTSTDGGKTFEPLPDVAGKPLNKTDGLTADQKAAVEEDALVNYVKTNFAGFVKDADGKTTNMLADKYGNPLVVGKTELTTEMLEVDGAAWDASDIADAVGINDQGEFIKADGTVITKPDPNDATQTIPVTVNKMEFTDDAFGTVPTAANPGAPTPEEEKAIKKAQEEIKDKTDAAAADLNKQALNNYLAVNGAYKMGGNLFSNRGDTDDATNITALNISVSQSWTDGSVHVVPSYIKLFSGEGTNTTQQENALHMGNLMNRKLVYDPQDLTSDAASSYLFQGSFQEFLEKMGTTQGTDQNMTKVSLETHAGQALDIDTSRDSVSAVDLNDEAMNLMQYTHSLSAAYRLMTTIDEMIERLITGTGVTR